MASGNSQEIIEYKRTAMSKLISSDIIVKALNAKTKSGKLIEPGDLYYTHVFPYAFIPFTVDTVGTYITLEISMPQVSTVNYFFKDVLLTITIIAHQDAMQMVDSEPLGATGATRTDFISVEIDKLFNKTKGVIGPYELELVSNIEGAIDTVHRCRIMRFKTSAPIKSLC